MFELEARFKKEQKELMENQSAFSRSQIQYRHKKESILKKLQDKQTHQYEIQQLKIENLKRSHHTKLSIFENKLAL